MSEYPERLPPQQQERKPGREKPMHPRPVYVPPAYKGSGKLDGEVALVTGGDSGIGRSTSVLFAREGADVAIAYLDEHDDAKETKKLVEAEGRRCILLPGDVGDEDFCNEAVRRTVAELGGLNVLVNNAAEHWEAFDLRDISTEQLERTFRTNIYGYFFMARAALDHLSEGDAIINVTSVTAYRGSEHLVDYAATKGAIVAFTRSLAKQLADRGIRVNGIAPGPIWTPLIPASFEADAVKQFGTDVPLGRPGQPAEIGTCAVFLACEDSSYMTGQVLHPNGGEIVGG